MPPSPQLPFLVLRFVDGSESQAERRVWVRADTDPAAGLAAGRTLGALIADASGCSFVEAELRYGVRLIPPAGATGPSSVHESVLLIFSTTDPAQYGSIEIRGVRASLIDPEDNTRVLIDSPELSNLIDAIISGGYVNRFGYPLVECVAALHEIRQ